MTSLAELPSSEDICMLVSEVWSSFLGEDSLPVELSRHPVSSTATAEDQVRSTVGIAGAWNGELTLVMTSAAVAVVARAMFGDTGIELAQDELADVAGELGNIIAGNIKSILAEPSVLSLPHVVFGTPLLEAAEVSGVRAVMSWDEHPVTVSLNTTHHCMKDGA